MKGFRSATLVLSLLTLAGGIGCKGKGPATPREACDYYDRLIKETAKCTGLDVEMVEREDSDGPLYSPECVTTANFRSSPAGFDFYIRVILDGKVEKYWQEIAVEARESMDKTNDEMKRDGFTVDWSIDAQSEKYIEKGRAINEAKGKYFQTDCVCRRIRFGEVCWSSNGDPANKDAAGELKSVRLDQEPFLPPKEWLDLFESID